MDQQPGSNFTSITNGSTWNIFTPVSTNTSSMPICANVYGNTRSYPTCASEYSVSSDPSMVTSMAMEAIRPFIIMVLLVLIETIKNGTTNEEIVRSIEDLARLAQRSTLEDMTKLLVDFERKKKKEVPMDGELLKLVSKLE